MPQASRRSNTPERYRFKGGSDARSGHRGLQVQRPRRRVFRHLDRQPLPVGDHARNLLGVGQSAPQALFLRQHAAQRLGLRVPGQSLGDPQGTPDRRRGVPGVQRLEPGQPADRARAGARVFARHAVGGGEGAALQREEHGAPQCALRLHRRLRPPAGCRGAAGARCHRHPRHRLFLFPLPQRQVHRREHRVRRCALRLPCERRQLLLGIVQSFPRGPGLSDRLGDHLRHRRVAALPPRAFLRDRDDGAAALGQYQPVGDPFCLRVQRGRTVRPLLREYPPRHWQLRAARAVDRDPHGEISAGASFPPAGERDERLRCRQRGAGERARRRGGRHGRIRFRFVSTAAVHYDGRTSQRTAVELYSEGATLRVLGSGIDRTWPWSEVRVSSRVGNTARHLYLPDGSQCETADNDAIDAWLAARHGADRFSVHRIERRLRYALAALALTAVAVWLGFAYGIPALAKQVAFRLPASTERLIGADALRALDQTLLGPSALPPERAAELQKLFAGVTADLASHYRLELRARRQLGANPPALPSGIIVLTDELVKLADDDRQILAVLAHDLGHMRQRHALRSVLQNSTAAVLFAMAVGDPSSVTPFAAALPTLLLQAKYSREF